MRCTTAVFHVLLSLLLVACTVTPARQQSDRIFEERRVHSPVFPSASECMSWLKEQNARGEYSGEHFGQQLILTSWNAQKSSGRRWEEQVHELIEQADILLMQEAAITPAKQEVLPYPFVAVAEAFKGWLGPTGLMSASHVEPIASCTFINHEPVVRSKKASNALLFPLPGRTERLLVINIHSINFSLGLGAYNKQIEQLFQLMAVHAGPIIFAGDLNTWNQRREDLVDELARELSLAEVEFSLDTRVRFLGRALDRVYYRGLYLLDARTTTSKSSDHDPLIVTWTLAPAD